MWATHYKWLSHPCADFNDVMFRGFFTFERPQDSQCFDIYFFSIYPIYCIFFTICSFLGLISGYFYCFCLPYIFIKIDVIQHVVKAVAGKGKLLFHKTVKLLDFVLYFSAKQLIFVGLLLLALLLIYAMFSFALMYNFFNPETPLFCNTMWECYVTVIREGLLNTFGAVSSFKTLQELGH